MPGKGTKGMKSNRPPLKPGPDGVVLLSGGNPQIPIGDGDAPVEAFIRAVPGWKGDVARRLDEIIVRTVPNVHKAVKWMGSPVWERDAMLLVGNAHKGKVKRTFAYGAKFPDPDGLFNGNDTGATRRSIDIFEGDELSEKALTNLVRTAITYNTTHLRKNTGK